MNHSRIPRRLLVTGCTGFVGQSLANWLPASRWAGRFELVSAPAGLDVREAGQVRELVAATRPDDVLHLAAQSFVPASFQDPAATLAVNLGGTLNLLRALEAHGFKGRMLYVSSADVYGAVAPHSLPVTETIVAAPRNPYAVSKLAAETLCRQWHFSEGFNVVVARPFNHTGPGQDARFVLSGFARKTARILAGIAEPRFITGNLDATRDFSDVRDVLDAYMALFEQGRAGEIYNVCSGIERKVGELLRRMLERAGIQADVVTDAALLRPNEQLRMVGSADKLREHTDWQPRCDLDATLADMVAWWQAKETD